MFSRIRKSLMIAVLALGFAVPLALPVGVAYASGPITNTESGKAACEGIGLTGNNCGNNAERRVYSLIGTIVTILSIIIGAVAVIMIIISGFKYITSNGDSNAISSAKTTLIYAIIGLIIVILAQTIIQFVFKAAI